MKANNNNCNNVSNISFVVVQPPSYFCNHVTNQYKYIMYETLRISLLLSGVLTKVNKKRDRRVTRIEITLLFCVHQLGGVPGAYIAVTKIYQTCYKIFFSTSYTHFKYKLDQLVIISGYLSKTEQKRGKMTFTRYSLTIPAINLLNEVEELLNKAKKVKIS